jgi:hypothetical protein
VGDRREQHQRHLVLIDPNASRAEIDLAVAKLKAVAVQRLDAAMPRQRKSDTESPERE